MAGPGVAPGHAMMSQDRDRARRSTYGARGDAYGWHGRSSRLAAMPVPVGIARARHPEAAPDARAGLPLAIAVAGARQRLDFEVHEPLGGKADRLAPAIAVVGVLDDAMELAHLGLAGHAAGVGNFVCGIVFLAVGQAVHPNGQRWRLRNFLEGRRCRLASGTEGVDRQIGR
jgi:hypothetical protein